MTSKHPTDVDIVEFAEHLRECSLCRLKVQRIMNETDEEAEHWRNITEGGA